MFYFQSLPFLLPQFCNFSQISKCLSSMEETPRKRGRPKLFLTKEMVGERRVLKRLCKNSRQNLRVQKGEPPTREGTDAALDEISGVGPLNEILESSNAVGGDPPDALLVDFVTSFGDLGKAKYLPCSLRVCIRFIIPIHLAPYPLPPEPAPPTNGSQNQLVCSGCRNLLLYPLGATSVCCAVCNAVTAVQPPANQVAHVNCGNCQILLMYQYGAQSVRCAVCHFATSGGSLRYRTNLEKFLKKNLH